MYVRDVIRPCPLPHPLLTHYTTCSIDVMYCLLHYLLHTTLTLIASPPPPPQPPPPQPSLPITITTTTTTTIKITITTTTTNHNNNHYNIHHHHNLNNHNTDHRSVLCWINHYHHLPLVALHGTSTMLRSPGIVTLLSSPHSLSTSPLQYLLSAHRCLPTNIYPPPLPSNFPFNLQSHRPHCPPQRHRIFDTELRRGSYDKVG